MSQFFRNLFNAFWSHFLASTPPKSYTLECDPVASRYQIRLKGANQYAHCHSHSHQFEAFFTRSDSGNQVACVMIKQFDHCKYTILFNHGGTVDLGNLSNFLFTLSQRLGCNILVYDYSGFGETAGSPTERAIYADAEAALAVLLDKYHLSLDRIIVYGQSLGTAPTLHLASRHQVAAIVLHSPFLSFAKLYLPKVHTGHCRFYDFFKK